ncbi:MAG: DNA mismatch repair protein MutS [Gammaproteobacteria bacterium]|nr:DNA mismatch repair protein MutS [Gammaproteobacteria bacterium]
MPQDHAVTQDTPLMRQWRAVKARHRDALVFIRVGDFFELFNEDARKGARLLGLTLTTRNNGAARQVPLAGVPAKALDDYLRKLVKLGCRVTICDQVEDASAAKGLVRREVVETITPGTVVHDELLEARRNNFLVALAPAGRETRGLAALDLSTGELVLEVVGEEALAARMGELAPAELLLPGSLEREALPGATPDTLLTRRDDWIFGEEAAREEVQRAYRVLSLQGFGIEAGDTPAVRAAGALLAYVAEIRPGGVAHLQAPVVRRPGSTMVVDEMTRRNLELTEPLRPGDQGATLISVLDDTVTAMGARTLRSWLLAPLLEAGAIWKRQETVGEFFERFEVRREVRGALSEVADLERLAGKISLGRVTPRDLLALARSLDRVPPVRRALATAELPRLRERGAGLDAMEDVREMLGRAIAPDAPATLQEGGVIKPGYDEDLDALRQTRADARTSIATLQARERERTGIGSLKVAFNKVFGYYLEVTRANLGRVPDDYVRKQTLANAERFFTPELKEWEGRILDAEDRIATLEAELFASVRGEVAEEVARLQKLGRALGRLDALAGLAEVAEHRGYVRPEVHSGYAVEVRAGRHPVVEAVMPAGSFVPNDLVLDDDGRVVVLTGPNMAGKSTILRQIGLIQLLAQMGSFVPADRARLPVCDRVFTRVGASDNLARGQSTFMVEMNESAAIVHGATADSLVLLDEIGRGTSTYDGVSIAWAVTEHLHEVVGAKTIFATHYHELTQLGELLPAVRNLNVAVRESGEDIVFLRRLEEGGADRSYGIQVARLAGMPPAIVERAKELLAELEGRRTRDGGCLGREGAYRPSSAMEPGQLSLFAAEAELSARLQEIDLDNMTPLESMTLLADLQRLARGARE